MTTLAFEPRALERTPSSSRYEMLDAWRGLAALSVLGFHCINSLVQADRSWFAAALWQGWAGVYLFFPISGYCILAASCSARHPGMWHFLQRRWRRIFPTYWASLIVAAGALVVFAPFSSGPPGALIGPGLGWLSIVTLTQGLAGMPEAINPVYWSLCYEEQFYVLIAGTMLLRPDGRAHALAALSLLACLAELPGVAAHLPAGLFVDHWMNFAVGLAVYGWFHAAYGRRWAALQLGLAVLVTVATRRTDLAISVIFAIVLIGLKPLDRAAAGAAALRWLYPLGLISYSLYLTHVPVAGRIVNLSRRFGASEAAWWPAVVLVAAAASLVFAYAFHLVFERPFMSAAAPTRVDLEPRLVRAVEN